MFSLEKWHREKFIPMNFYICFTEKRSKSYDHCPPDSQLMLHMMDYENHPIAHVGTGPNL